MFLRYRRAAPLSRESPWTSQNGFCRRAVAPSVIACLVRLFAALRPIIGMAPLGLYLGVMYPFGNTTFVYNGILIMIFSPD
jgi:hypothetical protein